MSTERRKQAKRIQNAEGVTLCSCGCGQIPKPPRRTWFSDACVERWRAVNDPSYIRRELKKRDKGICAICGCDSEAEYRRYIESAKEATRLLQWLEDREHRRLYLQRDRLDNDPWKTIRHLLWPESDKNGKTCYKTLHAERAKELIRLGVVNPGWTHGRSTAWDADHIVPVVEGGGLCGLENYRTLCHPCHKRVTAELAGRLAEQRRTAKRQQAGDLFIEPIPLP